MPDSIELSIHIKMAKTRICSLYSDTAGACYLGFSGGKDSTILLALIKELQEEGRIRENAIPAVYADTGIELQATKDFVEWVKENYYSNVVILKPEKTFSQIIKEYGKPFRSKIKAHLLHLRKRNPDSRSAMILTNPNSRGNFQLANKDFHILHPDFDIEIDDKCCEYMKKRPFKKYNKDNDCLGTIQGIRAAEGGAREINYLRDIKNGKPPCTHISGDFIQKAPIIDWTDEMCEEFIVNHNVPLSKAYTEYGCRRTGCFLCPFSKNLESDLKVLFDFEPQQYKASMHWMKDIFIAQNVVLPFDTEYEREREEVWLRYSDMRYEMLLKYRPDCKLVKEYEKEHENGTQLSFDI